MPTSTISQQLTNLLIWHQRHRLARKHKFEYWKLALRRANAGSPPSLKSKNSDHRSSAIPISCVASRYRRPSSRIHFFGLNRLRLLRTWHPIVRQDAPWARTRLKRKPSRKTCSKLASGMSPPSRSQRLVQALPRAGKRFQTLHYELGKAPVHPDLAIIDR